jgi:hypothetical protein
MSWTKRQFVRQAFSIIGLADYDFDLQAEQLQNAMYLLDSMMAVWNAKGLLLSYPIPTSPEDGDLDTESNVPDRANEAVYTNLALRIAPTLGKQVSQDLKAQAWYAYNGLLSWAKAYPREMSMPVTMPSGAGNKPYRYDGDEFLDPAAEPAPPWGD